MGVRHIEACLLHAEIGIHVHECEITALHLALVVEVHQRWVVGWGVVTGVVVAIGTQLHLQHFSHGKFDEQIAVNGKLRQRQHLLVAARLIGEFVVPSENAEAKMLPQCGTQHMDRR